MAITDAKLFISKNYLRVMCGYLFYICFCIDIIYENNIAVGQLLRDTICWKSVRCILKNALVWFSLFILQAHV